MSIDEGTPVSFSSIAQWLALGVVGLVQWIFHREREQMKDHRETCDAHRSALDDRLRSVEQRSATREDIHALRDDIQRGLAETRAEVREQIRLVIESRGSR